MIIALHSLPPLVFDVPWLLLFALLLPLLIWWLRRRCSQCNSERLARYASLPALGRLMISQDAGKARRTFRLTVVGALIGVALAGPRWGIAHGPASSSGIDMAIAIDASLSMLAKDEQPSRLERVKQEVRRLRAMSPADRVALMAFAGRSYILTPLTNDDGALELLLDNLDPSVVGQAGSALARTIRQGTELLTASDGGADRALVIFTDGEAFDSAEDIEAAASDAGRQGVSLVTVGIGTEEGATIPTDIPGRPKRDQEGNVVVTHYIPELLQKAAAAANGTFIPAGASDKASRVRAALRSLRTARRTVDTHQDHVPRFLWLMVPALMLLAWDSWRLVCPSGRDSRRILPGYAAGGNGSATLLAMMVVVTGVLGSCGFSPDPATMFADGDVPGAFRAYGDMVATGDTTMRTAYNLGTVLIAVDSLSEASERLEAARRATDGELLFRSRFNAGLAALIMGRRPGSAEGESRLADARAAYRALLTDRPGYHDAQWNYELALRRPTSGGAGGGGGNGAQDQQQTEQPQSQPPGGLDQKQAEALLNSAAREERDVQGRRQRQTRIPVQGRDW